MSVLEGSIIEKGGVNISTVSGEFSETMQKEFCVQRKTPPTGQQASVWFFIRKILIYLQCILTPDFYQPHNHGLGEEWM